MWNSIWGWLKPDPSRESQNITSEVNGAGGKGISPGTDTSGPSYLQQAGNLLPSIKNDLEWVLIALVGLLAYAFIFKD